MKVFGISILFILLLIGYGVFNLSEKQSAFKKIAEEINQLCKTNKICPKTMTGWTNDPYVKNTLSKEAMKYKPYSNFQQFELTIYYGPDTYGKTIGGVNIDLEFYHYDEIKGQFVLNDENKK